jgi:hypothetical protein
LFIERNNRTGHDQRDKIIQGSDQLLHNAIEYARQRQYVPPLDGQDAIKIRTRFLFFDSQFVANPKGSNQFQQDDDFTTEYLLEVFSWAAQGAYEYYKPRQLKCLKKSRNAQML